MKTYQIWTGRYTDVPGEAGVQRFLVSEKGLNLEQEDCTLTSPSYLLPTREGLLAVEERGDLATVAAFRTEEDALSLLWKTVVPGAGACHISQVGNHCYASNYGTGSVAGVSLETGAVCAFVQHRGQGANPLRQEGPHAHSAQGFGENQLLVADLGADKLFRYKITQEGGLLPYARQPFLAFPPGSGPRHFAYSLTGELIYVVTELTCMLMTCRLNEGGMLEIVSSTSLLTPGEEAAEMRDALASGGDIHLSPDGRFLYASVRGVDRLVCFSLEVPLCPVQSSVWGAMGTTPRSFHLSEDGKLLIAANQGTGNLCAFPIFPETGELGELLWEYKIPGVSCVKFLGSPV